MKQITSNINVNGNNDVESEMKSFDYLKYRVFCRVFKVTESDYVNDMAEYLF